MKRRLVSAGVVLFLAFVAGEARAQTGTARGKVVDEKGQPLPDAKVQLEFLGGVTRKYEVKTNKKGEFTQVGIHPGPYKITASKEGYQPTYIETRIPLGEPTYLPEFKLVSAAASKAAGGDAAAEEIQDSFAKAVELSRAGKFDQAEALYKEILAKKADIPQVHYNLGYIHGQKKDWAAAEAAYLKALELKPEYSEASLALANIYQQSGRKDEALELMSRSSGENDPRVQFNLGVMRLNNNEYDKAEEAFKKAEALDASNPELQFHLASIALNQGKAEECVARLEKYLSMSPQNAQNKATAEGLLAALKPKK